MRLDGGDEGGGHHVCSAKGPVDERAVAQGLSDGLQTFDEGLLIAGTFGVESILSGDKTGAYGSGWP